MKRENDIFDRIFQLPGIVRFYPVFQQYREVLLYLFFGGAAFVISIGSYGILIRLGQMNELIANVFSWIITVTFAYFTNRGYVFESSVSAFSDILREMSAFFGARVLTLVIEEIILFVFITWLRFDSMFIKVMAQVIVIFLNYVFSKRFVFHNDRD